MARVADVDDAHRAIRRALPAPVLPAPALPARDPRGGGVEPRVGPRPRRHARARVPHGERQRIQRRQRLGQRRLARHIERQRHDRRDRAHLRLARDVIGRDQDQVGPDQLQQLEIGGAAQAQVHHPGGDRGRDRVGAKADQLAGGDGHVADGDGGFQHRPVDGGKARAVRARREGGPASRPPRQQSARRQRQKPAAGQVGRGHQRQITNARSAAPARRGLRRSCSRTDCSSRHRPCRRCW